MKCKRHRRRKGLGTTEWVVIAAIIALTVVGTVATLGTRTNDDLNVTANDVADPSQLVNRFGN